MIRFLSLLVACSQLLAISTAVWPSPQRYRHGSTILWLSPTKIVHRIEQDDPNDTSTWAGLVWMQQLFGLKSNAEGKAEDSKEEERALLEQAIASWRKAVLDGSFIPSKFHPKGAPFEPDAGDQGRQIREIVLSKTSGLPRPGSAAEDGDEAYALRIREDGTVQIDFEHVVGGLAALQTLAQLFYRHSEGAGDLLYTPYAPVDVSDAPAFAHRGLNLDIARNVLRPRDVLRTIDGMALVRLNRLHLHASDAQSWPLDIPALPDLAARGAYDDAQIWTVGELHSVQAYGRQRGVQVIVEIDLPGHTTAIGEAYPDLLTAANEAPWAQYAAEPPAGQLRLNSSKVYTFLDTLFADLLPRVRPFSPLFHFGGDEVNRAAYMLDPTVRSADPAVLQPLLQTLTDHLHGLAAAHGLTPVFWEEMALDWDLNLPPSTIIQLWRSQEALASVLNRGHRALFGPRPYWYFDCGLGGFLDPDPSKPDSPIRDPFDSSCAPYKNWRHVLSYDPLEGVPQSKRHLIVGGEAHLWSELTDSISLDGMLWPRLAAAAEVLWQGGRKMDEDATRRLAELRERLVARGIQAAVVQMEYCLRYEGKCSA